MRPKIRELQSLLCKFLINMVYVSQVKDFFFISRFSWLCAFLVSKFQKNVNDAINPSGGYFLFGAVLLLGKEVQIVYRLFLFTAFYCKAKRETVTL